MRHRQPWILALVIAIPLAGCATPDSDTDLDPEAEPREIRTLPLDLKHSDRLVCQNKPPRDCVDLFSLNLPGKGEIQLGVTATNPDGLIPDYAVSVATDRGDRLRQASNQGRREVSMVWSGDPGAYFVAVSSDAARLDLQYDIVARYQPGPPIEESQPPFQTTSWMVLEVETAGGQPRYVIIDGGSKNGLQQGFRGRLIERGRSIAEIEIVEVYDEGSRARIATELVDRITPQTAAEIDVPVGDTR